MIPKKVMNDDQSRPHEPSKCVKAHFPFNGLCGTLSSLVIFLNVIRFVKIFSTVLTGSSLELQCALVTFLLFFWFFFSLLYLHKLQGKRKNKETKNKISEAHRGSNNNTTNKDIDKTNLITSRKVTNGDQRMPYKPSEDKWALTHLNSLCGPRWWPF